MTTASSKPTTWIGLVQVVPAADETPLGDAKGAFVNVLAIADDRIAFEKQACAALASLGLRACAFEDTEPFVERLQRGMPDVELEVLAHQVAATGVPHYGTFHTYESE